MISGGSSTNFWLNFFVNNRLFSGTVIILIYLIVISIFGFIIADHIKKIYLGQRTILTGFSEKAIYFIEKISGVDENESHTFKGYFFSLLFFNLMAGVFTLLFLLIQTNYFPLPGQRGFSFSLAINTISSFLTNTNLQNYSSPQRLSYYELTIVIIGLMFLSAGTGFAASMAFIRGIIKDDGKLGNFFHDFLVAIFELILPLSLLATVIFLFIGIPETTSSFLYIHPFFSKSVIGIPIGPVASLEGIKNIGTNGGGFYGANAGYPFENPNWISNIVEVVSFTIIPMGSIFALGRVLESRNFGRMVFGVIMSLFMLSAFFTFFGEYAGLPTMSNLGLFYTGNFLGKETALGISQTSIFASGATMTSTGAANSALNAFTPAGILGVLFPMLLNDPLGGVGTGILNIFTYVIFTIFLVALMVGKLPELFSLKISSKEIKYSTYSLITHPLLIVVPLGITLLIPALMSSFVSPRPDQITELLYEFSSAAANNGSAMGGFQVNQAFFNILEAGIMLTGRFLVMGFQLMIAQSFAFKKPKVTYGRSVNVGSFWFGFMLFFTMILLGLLSFFPVLALGPLLAWGKDFNLLIGVIH